MPPTFVDKVLEETYFNIVAFVEKRIYSSNNFSLKAFPMHDENSRDPVFVPPNIIFVAPNPRSYLDRFQNISS